MMRSARSTAGGSDTGTALDPSLGYRYDRRVEHQHVIRRLAATALLPALLVASSGPGALSFFCRYEQTVHSSCCCPAAEQPAHGNSRLGQPTCCDVSRATHELPPFAGAQPELASVTPPLPVPAFALPALLETERPLAGTPLERPTGPPILQQTRALLI